MACSAIGRRRFRREVTDLLTNPLPGITVQHSDSDETFIRVDFDFAPPSTATSHAKGGDLNLASLIETQFYGAHLHLHLEIDEYYPVRPPKVSLLTDWEHHSHVYGNKICLSILSDFQPFFEATDGKSNGEVIGAVHDRDEVSGVVLRAAPATVKGYSVTPARTTYWNPSVTVRYLLASLFELLGSDVEREKNRNLSTSERERLVSDAVRRSKLFKCNGAHCCEEPYVENRALQERNTTCNGTPCSVGISTSVGRTCNSTTRIEDRSGSSTVNSSTQGKSQNVCFCCGDGSNVQAGPLCFGVTFTRGLQTCDYIEVKSSLVGVERGEYDTKKTDWITRGSVAKGTDLSASRKLRIATALGKEYNSGSGVRNVLDRREGWSNDDEGKEHRTETADKDTESEDDSFEPRECNGSTRPRHQRRPDGLRPVGCMIHANCFKQLNQIAVESRSAIRTDTGVVIHGVLPWLGLGSSNVDFPGDEDSLLQSVFVRNLLQLATRLKWWNELTSEIGDEDSSFLVAVGELWRSLEISLFRGLEVTSDNTVRVFAELRRALRLKNFDSGDSIWKGLDPDDLAQLVPFALFRVSSKTRSVLFHELFLTHHRSPKKLSHELRRALLELWASGGLGEADARSRLRATLSHNDDCSREAILAILMLRNCPEEDVQDCLSASGGSTPLCLSMDVFCAAKSSGNILPGRCQRCNVSLYEGLLHGGGENFFYLRFCKDCQCGVSNCGRLRECLATTNGKDRLPDVTATKEKDSFRIKSTVFCPFHSCRFGSRNGSVRLLAGLSFSSVRSRQDRVETYVRPRPRDKVGDGRDKVGTTGTHGFRGSNGTHGGADELEDAPLGREASQGVGNILPHDDTYVCTPENEAALSDDCWQHLREGDASYLVTDDTDTSDSDGEKRTNRAKSQTSDKRTPHAQIEYYVEEDCLDSSPMSDRSIKEWEGEDIPESGEIDGCGRRLSSYRRSSQKCDLHSAASVRPSIIQIQARRESLREPTSESFFDSNAKYNNETISTMPPTGVCPRASARISINLIPPPESPAGSSNRRGSRVVVPVIAPLYNQLPCTDDHRHAEYDDHTQQSTERNPSESGKLLISGSGGSHTNRRMSIGLADDGFGRIVDFRQSLQNTPETSAPITSASSRNSNSTPDVTPRSPFSVLEGAVSCARANLHPKASRCESPHGEELHYSHYPTDRSHSKSDGKPGLQPYSIHGFGHQQLNSTTDGATSPARSPCPSPFLSVDHETPKGRDSFNQRRSIVGLHSRRNSTRKLDRVSMVRDSLIEDSSERLSFAHDSSSRRQSIAKVGRFYANSNCVLEEAHRNAVEGPSSAVISLLQELQEEQAFSRRSSIGRESNSQCDDNMGGSYLPLILNQPHWLAPAFSDSRGTSYVKGVGTPHHSSEGIDHDANMVTGGTDGPSGNTQPMAFSAVASLSRMTSAAGDERTSENMRESVNHALPQRCASTDVGAEMVEDGNAQDVEPACTHQQMNRKPTHFEEEEASYAYHNITKVTRLSGETMPTSRTNECPSPSEYKENGDAQAGLLDSLSPRLRRDRSEALEGQISVSVGSPETDCNTPTQNDFAFLGPPILSPQNDFTIGGNCLGKRESLREPLDLHSSGRPERTFSDRGDLEDPVLGCSVSRKKMRSYSCTTIERSYSHSDVLTPTNPDALTPTNSRIVRSHSLEGDARGKMANKIHFTVSLKRAGAALNCNISDREKAKCGREEQKPSHWLAGGYRNESMSNTRSSKARTRNRRVRLPSFAEEEEHAFSPTLCPAPFLGAGSSRSQVTLRRLASDTPETQKGSIRGERRNSMDEEGLGLRLDSEQRCMSAPSEVQSDTLPQVLQSYPISNPVAQILSIPENMAIFPSPSLQDGTSTDLPRAQGSFCVSTASGTILENHIKDKSVDPTSSIVSDSYEIRSHFQKILDEEGRDVLETTTIEKAGNKGINSIRRPMSNEDIDILESLDYSRLSKSNCLAKGLDLNQRSRSSSLTVLAENRSEETKRVGRSADDFIEVERDSHTSGGGGAMVLQSMKGSSNARRSAVPLIHPVAGFPFFHFQNGQVVIHARLAHKLLIKAPKKDWKTQSKCHLRVDDTELSSVDVVEAAECAIKCFNGGVLGAPMVQTKICSTPQSSSTYIDVKFSQCGRFILVLEINSLRCFEFQLQDNKKTSKEIWSMCQTNTSRPTFFRRPTSCAFISGPNVVAVLDDDNDNDKGRRILVYRAVAQLRDDPGTPTLKPLPCEVEVKCLHEILLNEVSPSEFPLISSSTSPLAIPQRDVHLRQRRLQCLCFDNERLLFWFCCVGTMQVMAVSVGGSIQSYLTSGQTMITAANDDSSDIQAMMMKPRIELIMCVTAVPEMAENAPLPPSVARTLDDVDLATARRESSWERWLSSSVATPAVSVGLGTNNDTLFVALPSAKTVRCLSLLSLPNDLRVSATSPRLLHTTGENGNCVFRDKRGGPRVIPTHLFYKVGYHKRVSVWCRRGISSKWAGWQELHIACLDLSPNGDISQQPNGKSSQSHGRLSHEELMRLPHQVWPVTSPAAVPGGKEIVLKTGQLNGVDLLQTTPGVIVVADVVEPSRSKVTKSRQVPEKCLWAFEVPIVRLAPDVKGC